MIRVKIKEVAFECDEEKGIGRVIVDGYTTEYKNAIEAWNTFSIKALYPFEKALRDGLEKNGFNRWTGTRKFDYTESELKAYDDAVESARRKSHEF